MSYKITQDKAIMSFDAEWLFDAIHYAEDSSLSKGYELSFAGGGSGVSYGAMQIDLATNDWYRDDFVNLMGDSGKFQSHEVNQIASLIPQRSATEAQWASLEVRVNDVLSSNYGKQVVDEMNEHYFENTFAPRIEKALDAAADNPNGLGALKQDHPDYQESLAFVAAWINRTGEPTAILNYLSGRLDGESVTLDGIKDYIAGNKQFRDKADGGNGENFSNWATRIEDSVKHANSNNATEMGSHGESHSLSASFDDFSDVIDPHFSHESYGSVSSWSATIFTDNGDQIDVLFEGNDTQFDIFLNELHEKGKVDNTSSSWVTWFVAVAGIDITDSSSSEGSNNYSGGGGGGGGWSSSDDWDWDWGWSSSSSDWGSGTVTSSSWWDS